MNTVTWHKASEKIPQSGIPVLACVENIDHPIVLEIRWERCDSMSEGYFDDYTYWDCPDNDGQEYSNVYAWTELPKKCTEVDTDAKIAR